MAFQAINELVSRNELPFLIMHCVENYLCLALNTFIRYSLTRLLRGRLYNLPYLLSSLYLYASVCYLDIGFPSSVLNFFISPHMEAVPLKKKKINVLFLLPFLIYHIPSETSGHWNYEEQ